MGRPKSINSYHSERLPAEASAGREATTDKKYRQSLAHYPTQTKAGRSVFHIVCGLHPTKRLFFQVISFYS